MMTDPSYAQRVAVRSIQTLFCYARGTEGATRAAAGANASAMRSLFILSVLWQAARWQTSASTQQWQVSKPLDMTRQPSGERCQASGSTSLAFFASETGRAPAAPETRGL